MCNYRKDNQCTLTNKVCPWVYWCDKIGAWRELQTAPKKCSVVENYEVPKGYYKVLFERHGYLYVAVGNTVIKLKNIFNEVPIVVKLSKVRGEWKIKKENKGNED